MFRVPLAIRWPGVSRAGVLSDEPVVTQDLFFTLLEAAGAGTPPAEAASDADGVSLAAHLRTGAPLGRDALFWHYPHYHHLGDMRPAGAIRSGRYKLLEWYEGSLLSRGPAVSLFDLVADPGELRDLALEEPDLAAQLRERLRRWRVSVEAQEMSARECGVGWSNASAAIARRTMSSRPPGIRPAG